MFGFLRDDHHGDMQLTDHVKEVARAAGADVVGVGSADPFDEVAASIRDRVERGLSGRLRQTYADPDTSTDPRATHPWAQRLVTVGCSYVPRAESGPGGPGIGRVARFATADHYRVVHEAAGAVASLLAGHGHRAEVMIDDPRLVDRAAAVRAGVGWWGKNTMVLAPGFGPWLLLGTVVTDAVLDVDTPQVRSCGTCEACLPACPTGALIAPGVLDARRCLAAVLQAPGDIPLELREAVGDRIYGCDDCLDACPPGVRIARRPGEVGSTHDLAELAAMDDTTLMDRFAHWYVPHREARHLRRNISVALANTGTMDHLPLLVELARHPSGLVRRHAAWGIARLGGRWGAGEVAAEALFGLAERETVPEVIDPIAEAWLSTAGTSNAYAGAR